MKLLFPSIAIFFAWFTAFHILPSPVITDVSANPSGYWECGTVMYGTGFDFPTEINGSSPGGQLFLENCARCHSKRLDRDLTGPALLGILDRAPGRKWLQDWIRNSPAMIEAGDAYALHLWEKWGRANMDPMPHLSDSDIDAILDALDI